MSTANDGGGTGKEAGEDKPKIGVCFSGGGIRSAAFCSGVLKKLLDRNVPINYISTVSGGGYVGSSLMDWTAKEDGGWRNIQKWKDTYFSHLKANFGLYINWKAGLLQVVVDIFMLIMVGSLCGVVLPLLTAVALIIPTAMVIRATAGDTLLKLVRCSNHTHAQTVTSDIGVNASSGTTTSNHVCFLSSDKLAFIAVVVSVVIACGALSRTLTVLTQRYTKSNPYVRLAGVLLVPLTQSGLWFIIYHVLMAGFALLFEDLTSLLSSDHQLSQAATVIQVAAVILVALFWVQLPLSPLKDQITTVVLLMIMARVVQFWVYRWDEPRVRQILEVLTYVAAFALVFMPIIGHAKYNLLFFFNRYPEAFRWLETMEIK